MTVQTPPDCFGKHWDPNVAECAGGFDRTYVGPNGSKTRERCDYFDGCRTRVTLAKATATQQAPIPPATLLRQQPPTSSPWQPPRAHMITPPQPAAPTTPTWQQPPPPQPPPWQQWQVQPHAQGQPQFPYQAQVAPIQMQPVSYNMPAYLSVPENRATTSFWQILLIEVLRGLGKSLGHSISHFFDHTPFKR